MAVVYNPRIVTDGLVLCMDAANPKSYPGSGVTWGDMSGRGYIGTLTNGPTFSNSRGGSIGFDGVDDYVNTGASATNLGIQNTLTNSFTITMWFRSTANTVYLFDNYHGGANISLRLISGKGAFYLQAGGSIDVRNVGAVYANGSWNEFTLTYDSSTKTGTLYANAELVGSGSDASMSGSFEGGGNFYIGNRNTFANGPLLGNVAAVSVYNRLLSSAELKQNYSALRGRFGV